MSSKPPSQGDFEAAFDAALPRLREAVLSACRRDADWPARIVAAIYAVLDFAVADPAAVGALTRDALLHRPRGPERYLDLLEDFAEMLRAQARRDGQPVPASTEKALVGAIAITVADHIRDERLDRLPEAGPELVELTLQPYLGRTAARRWSQRSPAA
jgi:hypothetical protein